VKTRVLNYMLICLYGVLWGGGVVAHLLWQRTPPGAQWTAPAFLACAAALVLLGASSGRVWLAAAGAGGFLAEGRRRAGGTVVRPLLPTAAFCSRNWPGFRW
jgi:hypothetical protein